MDLNRGNTLGMCITSTVSTVGALTMIIPYARFPDKISKDYHQILFNLTIANILNSISTIPGYPADGSFACYFEALFSNIFSLSIFFWIMVMNYEIYSIVFNKSSDVLKLNWKIYSLCWGLPVFLTLIPLVNMHIGGDGNGWCWIVPNDDTSDDAEVIWYWFSYYFWVWLAIISCTLTIIQILLNLKNIMHETRRIVLNVVKKFRYYPLVLVFCWSLTSISDTFDSLDYVVPGADLINTLTDYIPCLFGFFISVVFWSSSEFHLRGTKIFFELNDATVASNVNIGLFRKATENKGKMYHRGSSIENVVVAPVNTKPTTLAIEVERQEIVSVKAFTEAV